MARYKLEASEGTSFKGWRARLDHMKLYEAGWIISIQISACLYRLCSSRHSSRPFGNISTSLRVSSISLYKVSGASY